MNKDILLFYVVIFMSFSVLNAQVVDTVQSDINKMNPHEVYEPVIKSIDSDSMTMVMCHFSDIHGSLENGKRLFDFLGNYSSYMDCVFCSGDMISDVFGDDFSYWGQLNTKNVMFCLGNHDSTCDTGFCAAKQCFDRYFSPYIDGWNVCRPMTNPNEKCYYFKDYKEFGIRLVFIDSIHFDSEQAVWLNSVLEECLENGLAVICVCHYPPGRIIHNGNCFDSNNYSTWMYDEVFSVPMVEYGKMASPIVDSFIKRGGDFVVWLFGHIHCDICGVVMDYPDQFCLGVAETLWRDNYTGNFSDINRKYGEKSQDLFNIIGVNTIEKCMYVLRVGADVTRDNATRFKLKWNYVKNEQESW